MEKVSLFLKAVVSKLARRVLVELEDEAGNNTLILTSDTNTILQDMEKFQQNMFADQINSLRSDLRQGMNMLAGRLNENTEHLVQLTTAVEVLQNDLDTSCSEDDEVVEEAPLPPMTDKWPSVSMVDTTTKKRNGKAMAN